MTQRRVVGNSNFKGRNSRSCRNLLTWGLEKKKRRAVFEILENHEEKRYAGNCLDRLQVGLEVGFSQVQGRKNQDKPQNIGSSVGDGIGYG